jgi:hypothetical protein
MIGWQVDHAAALQLLLHQLEPVLMLMLLLSALLLPAIRCTANACADPLMMLICCLVLLHLPTAHCHGRSTDRARVRPTAAA